MSIKLFNTLTRKKEEFKTIEKNKVSLYSCGPTIYDYAHIGNFRAYICVDLLKRYLKYKGYSVKHVMNLTDVDDKTIKGSQNAGVSLSEYTQKFAEAFFEDLEALNVDKADVYPRATEHIEQQVALTKKLLEKGIAYKAEDGIYYDISKFSEYGKLSHTKLEKLEASKRVKNDEYDKENAQDFALWKFWDKEDGNVFWETDLGKGRPGWHLECSAMSSHHLGQPFDIHAGGIDLVFPHHENEIAQSEGGEDKPFAHFWFHNEHLHVNGKKMSKSLGNFFTLRDLIGKGHKPVGIRYLLLSTHYRVQLNLTEESIQGSQAAVDRINDFMVRLKEVANKNEDTNKDSENKIKKVKEKFEERMDDDLNISEALSFLFDFIREMNQQMDEGKLSTQHTQQIIEVMKQFDTVLGVIETPQDIPPEIQNLVQQREQARKEKDFETADRIRDEIKKKGYSLDDKEGGVRVKKI